MEHVLSIYVYIDFATGHLDGAMGLDLFGFGSLRWFMERDAGVFVSTVAPEGVRGELDT